MRASSSRGRQDLDPRRGQLDRQRQAVQPAADLDDRVGVARREREVGPGWRRPAGRRARSTRTPSAWPARTTRSASGSGKRRDRKLLLAVDVQHQAAGHEHLERRAGVEQFAHEGRPRRRPARSCPCSRSVAADGCAGARRSPSPAARSPLSRTPSARATADATRRGSAIGARLTNETPPSKIDRRGRRPPGSASRVFPVPPGPVSVSSQSEVCAALAAMWTRPKTFDALASGIESIPVSFMQAAGVTIPRHVPIAILSARDARPARLDARDRLLSGCAAGRHAIVAASGHWIQVRSAATCRRNDLVNRFVQVGCTALCRQ